MRIPIRNLLKRSTDELWKILDGPFTIVFDDGELETHARHTLYSSFMWDLLRRRPQIPLKMSYHVTHVLKDDYLGIATSNQVLANIVWDIYRAMENSVTDRVALREQLALELYDAINDMYNRLSYELEEYVVGMNIDDFIQLYYHPTLQQLYKETQPIDIDIKRLYRGINTMLREDPVAKENIIARLFRSKLIDENQLHQCLGVRGHMTDINSENFPHAIMRNLVNGIRSFHDSAIESRSASKSLAYSEEPLEQTEFFSRRSQLISQSVRYMEEGDCGAKTGLQWRVKDEDLKNLEGKLYIGDNGELIEITRNCKHLVGKTIELRSALACHSRNPYGICSTCFGRLSLAVLGDVNIGQFCTTYLNAIISQKVLSVKHLDGSSVVDKIWLTSEMQEFLHVNRSGDGYMLSPNLKGMRVRLVIKADQATGFGDIAEVKDVNDLPPGRVTSMNVIGLEVTDKAGARFVEDVPVGMTRRPASLTMAMLRHIREYGWSYDGNQNYVIDLENWDHKEVLMTIPLRHFNMSDHAEEIANVLEATTAMIEERDTETSIPSYITELFDVVNSRLSINLAVLEVVALGTLIVSAKDEDYSMPKPWTRSGIGVKARTINRRSLAVSMAFGHHREVLTAPISFTLKNRPDHQTDVMIDPRAVIEHKYGIPSLRTLTSL